MTIYNTIWFAVLVMLALLIQSPTIVASDQDGDCGFLVDCYPAIHDARENKDIIVPIPCDPFNNDCPNLMYTHQDHEIVNAPLFDNHQAQDNMYAIIPIPCDPYDYCSTPMYTHQDHEIADPKSFDGH